MGDFQIIEQTHCRAEFGVAVIMGVKRNETEAHRHLKTLAVAWAVEQGFVIAAPEIRVPRSGYRADVAAIGRGESARCALFECKQARADLLKDSRDADAAKRQLKALCRRRDKLEALLAEHRPDLRRGDALFAEYDAWDFGRLRHEGYHALLSEIATTQRQLIHGTKFAKLFRYQAADFLYLVVEDAIFAEAEIPAGWGLLVRCGDKLDLRRRPAALAPDEWQRRRLLESIAFRAPRRAYPPSAWPGKNNGLT